MPRLPRNLHLVATWRSPDNAICQKTRNTTRLKCCACHAKLRLTRPKCCACHENCNASSENVAKVLRLPHKMIRHVTARLNVTKCQACHAKRSNATCETSKSASFCRTYHRHGHTGLVLTVANGCVWLRTVAKINATSSEHTLFPQTPRVTREPLLRIRKKIKGPDSPTRQLLPIMSTKCCCGRDGERRKDKGGGGGSRSKTKLCVTKLYVKDGVWQRKVVCVRVWHIWIDVKLLLFWASTGSTLLLITNAGGGCMVWQSSTNDDTAFPWWYDKGTPLSRTCFFRT